MKLELSVSEGRVRITAEGRPLGELCYALRKGKNRLLPAEIKLELRVAYGFMF